MKKGISVAVFDTTFGPVVYSGATCEAWEEIFAKVRDAGYDGIDMFTDEKTESEMRTLKELLDRYGLGVGMMVSITMAGKGVDFASADETVRRRSVETYCGEIQKAGIFAPCTMSVGFIRGKLEQGRSLTDYLDRLAVSLRELTAFAKPLGVKLCIEPINRYEVDTLFSVPEVVEFIRAYQLEGTYILADLFHMNIEDANIGESLRMAGPLIGHMHVPDSNRDAPGMGHTDYHAVMRALKDVGYDGYLSSEAIPFCGSDRCAREGAAYLTKLIEQYR